MVALFALRGAFFVARLDGQGNARAFRMWNRAQDWLHVFYMYAPTNLNLLTKPADGAGGRQATDMQTNPIQLVYFHSRDILIRLSTDKIVFFESDGNYTYIVAANKQKFCITMNLSSTEKALSKQLSDNAKQFMRIGRRFIVNMKFINLIDIPKQRLLLSDSSLFTFSLPVSKDALKIVKELVLKSKL